MIFLFRFPQFRPKFRKMFLSFLEMGSFFRHLNILTSPEPESMRHCKISSYSKWISLTGVPMNCMHNKCMGLYRNLAIKSVTSQVFYGLS